MPRAVGAVVAACALAAVVAGAAWWMSAASAPKGRAAAPADTDAGITVAAPPEGLRVLIHVVDAGTGADLAGAEVIVREPDDEIRTKEYRGVTDAIGLARAALTPGVRGFEVFARAAGHCAVHEIPESETLDAPGSSVDVEVRLPAAGRVRGVVRNADGSAADGVAVQTDIGDTPEWPGDEGVVTSRGGRYVIDGIAPGTEFGVFAADGRRIASRHGLVVVSAGDDVEADLTLAVSARLSVRVLWPDGLPIAGASVSVEPEGESAADTDENGRTEFAALAAGRKHVFVTRTGFTDAEADVVLAGGETRQIDVRPVPNAVIAGVVVDEAGFAVADATVTIDAPGRPSARSLSDGRFRIPWPDDAPHDVVVEHESHSDVTVPGVSAPDEDLRIVLPRRPKIRARLVPPPGAALPGAVSAWWGERIAPATLDRDVLTIQIEPGAGRASFQVPGFVAVERDANVPAGRVLDWGDVALVATPRLRGRVTDAKGRGIRAFVYPRVGGASVPLTSTDGAGRFEFDGLPHGAAELHVEADGYVTRTVTYAFTPDAAPVSVQLVIGGSVKGKVVDADGAPAPKAVFVSFSDVKSPDDKARQAFPVILADGTFEVHLLPGRYRARALLDGRAGEAEVDVADGGTSQVTVTIPR